MCPNRWFALGRCGRTEPPGWLLPGEEEAGARQGPGAWCLLWQVAVVSPIQAGLWGGLRGDRALALNSSPTSHPQGASGDDSVTGNPAHVGSCGFLGPSGQNQG